MSVVLPLLLATSLSVSPVTGGVTGPSEPSFANIFQLNNQIGTETYIPPKNDTWDGTYSQYDGYKAVSTSFQVLDGSLIDIEAWRKPGDVGGPIHEKQIHHTFADHSFPHHWLHPERQFQSTIFLL